MNGTSYNLNCLQPERLTQTSPGSGRPTPATLGDRRQNPRALKRRRKAFTLVEVLVVVVTLEFLAVLLMPALVKRKKAATRINCASNLKHVSLAARIWAGDHSDAYPMNLSTNFGGTKESSEAGAFYRHFQILSNELNVPFVLTCPADRQRRPAFSWAALSNSNASYFIALDADEAQPQLFLSGDSNLEVDGKPVKPGLLNLWTNSTIGWTAGRHNRQGNVALADGSVQQYSNAKLGPALVVTGVATNRLAIP